MDIPHAHDIPVAGRSVDHGLAGNQHNADGAPDKLYSSLRDPVSSQGASFIGISSIMQDLYEQISQAAKSLAPVFIMGETGTGKEVCAETIHRHSPRSHKPFIALNCAAIPRDLLESELFGHVKGAFTGAITDRDGAATMANGGTLFLDEVAEMASDMQTKLLRFLQNFTFRKVGGNTLESTDARIICATNRDPLAEIASGHLRQDLFFRLHVLPLMMPPLRERGEDVIDIAYALLKRYSQEEGKRFIQFSPDVHSFLRHYSWPGNVRQLQNVIRYICVMYDGDIVTDRMLPHMLLHQPDKPSSVPAQLPASLPTNGNSQPRREYLPEWMTGMTLTELERHIIECTVSRMGGNVPQAAAHLGVAPSTLYRKRLSWGQDPEDPDAQNPASSENGGFMRRSPL